MNMNRSSFFIYLLHLLAGRVSLAILWRAPFHSYSFLQTTFGILFFFFHIAFAFDSGFSSFIWDIRLQTPKASYIPLAFYMQPPSYFLILLHSSHNPDTHIPIPFFQSLISLLIFLLLLFSFNLKKIPCIIATKAL